MRYRRPGCSEEKEQILAPLGIPVRSLLVESEYGDIVRGITGTATRERASLIVMGATGKKPAPHAGARERLKRRDRVGHDRCPRPALPGRRRTGHGDIWRSTARIFFIRSSARSTSQNPRPMFLHSCPACPLFGRSSSCTCSPRQSRAKDRGTRTAGTATRNLEGLKLRWIFPQAG